MKGLEASEVWLSSLFTGVETFRLDSEYHSNEYERIERFVKNNRHFFSKFEDWNVSIDCSAFYPGVEPLYGTGSIPLIRVQNVKERIDYDSCVTLPVLNEEYETLKRVQKGDIVITKGGTIGFVGYVTKEAYASRDLIFVKSSALNERDSVYLYLYLSTNFAFKQLIRSSSQCAQPHLTITLVKDFDIFTPTEELKNKCFNLYTEYLQKNDLSKSLYAAAEDQLLTELGLKNWQSDNENVNVKTLKESFLSSGRLDAEYYQSKYDVIESRLKQFNQTDNLGKICWINRQNVKPEDNSIYKYIELADVKHNGEISGCTIDKGINLPTRARQTVKTNNVIVSSIEGSLDSCAMISPEYDGAFCSTGFYVVESDKISSETLLVMMKLKPIQMLLKRACSGTILSGINYDNFFDVLLPIPDRTTQDEISSKIQKSFALKAESKRLLEEAKMMVEKEIEKGGE